MEDEDVGVRRCAARAIEYIGPKAKEAIPGLIKLIKANDGATGWAIGALGGMGPEAVEALPELAVTAKSADYLIRRDSLQAVRLIAPRDGRTVDILTKALEDENPSVRAEAAVNLGAIGSDAAPAIAFLRKALSDRDRSVAHAAKEALVQIERK